MGAWGRAGFGPVDWGASREESMSIKFDGKKRKSAPALSLILVWALAVGTMVLSLVKPVRAQEVTASITGTVADPTDAPVPGATVTAKDVDRGVTYPAETDAAGVYYIPHLPVGTYDVTVEAKGFASALRKGITLQLDQRARLDVRLALGTVTQVVEVTGSAPLLHTDSIQLDTVITSKINEELPLATRNYVQLTLLAPGSVNPNPGSFTGPQTTAASCRPYVNGNRDQSDN